MIENEFDLPIAAINERLLQHLDRLPHWFKLRALRFHDVGATENQQAMLVRFGRLLKTFEKPNFTGHSGSSEDPQDPKELVLHRAAVQRWLSVDERLRSVSKAYLVRLAFSDARLIRMKYLLHGWLKDFDWRIEDAWPGPGETYRTLAGRTNDIDRFYRVDTWTCTKSCFPFFQSFILANRPLRRFCIEEARKRYPALQQNIADNPGLAVELLTEVVIGGRLATVPKNNVKRRPINIEPLGNSIVQYAISRSLFRVLDRVGNSLLTGQQRHQHRLLTETGISTIDFSDASDSVSVELCRFLLPKEFFELLEQTRSKCIEVDGVFREPSSKISCQGNGWTFPLMTLILLAACKSCGDYKASVYGDDVIIDDRIAHDFIDLAQSIGFVVNKEKSFIRSEFKESCGVFTYASKAILCFDLKWAENPAECFANLNKIAWFATEGIDKSFWKRIHDDLIQLVPLRYRAPIPVSNRRDNLSFYAWTNGPSSGKRAGAAHWLEQRFQRLAGTIHKVQSFQPVSLIATDNEPHARYLRVVGESLRLRGLPPVRHIRYQVVWKPQTIFVDECGFLLTSNGYRYLRNSERDYLRKVWEGDITRLHWEAYTVAETYRGFINSYADVQGKNYLRER